MALAPRPTTKTVYTRCAIKRNETSLEIYEVNSQKYSSLPFRCLVSMGGYFFLVSLYSFI